MKKTLLTLFAALMATAALAQTIRTDATRQSGAIKLTDAERELVMQNSDFAFNLFRQIRTSENLVISPLSITYALGMLNNGADGITREEICRVLSGGRTTDYADVATMNEFCRKMMTESALLDKETRVAIANSIFFNGDRRDVSLKPAFEKTAATYYDAKPSVISFSDPTSVDVINKWATEHTDGMIRDLLKPQDMADPNLVSFLLNAICFKGAWACQFDETLTELKPFDGKRTMAMMMSQTNRFGYAENDLCQTVVLPYGNGAYEMTLLLPRKGKTIDDVLAVMDGKSWHAAEYKYPEVRLSIPRIETDTDQNLKEVMTALGMKNAFLDDNGHGFLEFCYLGDDVEASDRCWISLMRQKAHLKLDEKGTEAAAVTVIAMADKAVAMTDIVDFVADRPFLYLISERSTGSIFFIGQYMGEATKGVTAVESRPRATARPDVYDLQGRRVSQPRDGLYIVDGVKTVINSRP